MSDRNYPPAYLRYLKARLSNFLRPGFWGTAIFLLVVGLLVREYWLNPGLFTKNENKEPTKESVETKTTETNTEETAKETTQETTIADEDKLIAADIDNMPNLLSDFAQETVSANVTTLRINNEANNSETFLEDIINKRNADANQAKLNSSLGIVNQDSPASIENPFMVQAQNLLQSHRGNNENQFLGINNLATSPTTTEPTTTANLRLGLNHQTQNNQTQNNHNNIVVNPLEAAIKQSSNTNKINSLSSNGEVRTIYVPNGLPSQGLPSNAGVGYVQPTIINLPSTPYSNFNGVQTAPNTGIPTTGVSTIPNNPDSVQSPSQGVVNSTTPIGYSNYGNSAVQQPSQLPQSNLSYPGQMQPGNNGLGR
ncbi:MAG: hypothetical protein EAZ77_16060 [Nostocales cyanobacterium]|nr:MAG: hypothetical protein EAZ77_16060 [Nostocales cyanobacterium]